MLSFSQPWFLLGLVGLAIPVALHLINRRPARRWIFSSLRFLSPAPLPRQGRRKLSDLLLLLLRILAFAAIVFMLAGPAWLPTDPTSPKTQEKILLVDLSASINGWQAWQQTQQELAQFINDHPAHPIAVIAFADSILFESPPSIDHASLRRSLTELQPSLFPINPEIGLNRANEIRNLEYSEIHIWSDFQRSGWEDVNWPEIPAHQLHFHAVGQSRSGNVAILQAQSYPRDAETLEVLVFVRNDNAEAVELPIQLSWENRTETITASLEPWETGPVVMHIPLPATPYGLLSLPEDAFALDNRHYVYLGPPPPTRVLALRPSSGDPLVMEEIFFLATALETFTGIEPVRFMVDALGTGLLSRESLARYDALVLNSHTLIGDAVDATLLDAYVRGGGTIFLSLGEQPSAALQALRNTALSELRHEGTTGRQLTNLQRESVAALPMGSRLRDTFDGDAARDLYLTDLYNMHMLRGAREGSVLLQSENGYPLIVEMVSGQGRWILSAFPWHTRATDLPLRNAFLPLVKSIFAVATEEGGGLDRLDASSVGPDWQRHPGFHDLGDRAAVVNLARTESDAETIAHQWFPASTTGTGPAALAQANTGDPGTPLWYWLALAALLFFCLESLVCRIFERRYPSATPDVS